MPPSSLQRGLGNWHASEAIPNALPVVGNNPQKHPYYVEQISGTAFTRPRSNNKFTWVNRLLPSVALMEKFIPYNELNVAKDEMTTSLDPNPGRWVPDESSLGTDFVRGLRCFGVAGDVVGTNNGISIYTFNGVSRNMDFSAMMFSDGDLMVIPVSGCAELAFKTELGILTVKGGEFIVIPKGLKFSVSVSDEKPPACGYAIEVSSDCGGFMLPEFGVIGPNALAGPQDFEIPHAAYDEFSSSSTTTWEQVKKMGGKWFRATAIKHSPFNVVAWSGTYYPYKYDLKKFKTINTVSYDHIDPSIFCVMTVPSSTPGVAICDFVIFPHRWIVAEHTFRPPYFHRNCMSEFMGLIVGGYDGKTGGGFVPGGASLHNRFQAHGPDVHAFETASKVDLVPTYFNGGLAFMWESCYVVRLSEYARNGKGREVTYQETAWGGFGKL